MIANGSSCFAIDNSNQTIAPPLSEEELADTESKREMVGLKQNQVKLRVPRDMKYPSDVKIPFFNSFKSTSYDTRQYCEVGVSQIRIMIQRGKGF